MKELALFKKHFGEYRIIKDFKGEKMKVNKKLEVISVKPSGDGMRYAVMTTDKSWYSTFDQKIGKYVEALCQGDVVEIEFTQNAKGFSNFTSIKLVDDDKEFREEFPEEPPEEESVEKPRPAQRRGIDRMDKNCISAGNMAIELMGLLDLSKLKEEGIVEKFKALWEIIKEEIEE